MSSDEGEDGGNEAAFEPIPWSKLDLQRSMKIAVAKIVEANKGSSPSDFIIIIIVIITTIVIMTTTWL